MVTAYAVCKMYWEINDAVFNSKYYDNSNRYAIYKFKKSVFVFGFSSFVAIFDYIIGIISIRSFDLKALDYSPIALWAIPNLRGYNWMPLAHRP